MGEVSGGGWAEVVNGEIFGGEGRWGRELFGESLSGGGCGGGGASVGVEEEEEGGGGCAVGCGASGFGDRVVWAGGVGGASAQGGRGVGVGVGDGVVVTIRTKYIVLDYYHG